MSCTLTDHYRPRLFDDRPDGPQFRGRHGRSGSVEQRAHRRLRDKVLLDVAVQTARVLQLVRGPENTETLVRDEHQRQDELHEHVGGRQHGGKRD